MMTPYEMTRTVLFAPASRPERFAKACNSGADVVVIDLEDGVAPTDKDTAREALRQYLDATPEASLVVRINAADTKEFAADLELCRQQRAVVAIMLAKAESVEAVQLVTDTHKAVWPLIETARGVVEMSRMAEVDGVERFCLGALDMGADLRIKPDSAGAELLLNRIRCDLVICSKAAGLNAPIETVCPSIEDEKAVERLARQACEMGFGGMLCIHPRQLSPIHRGFYPDEAEIIWARKVLMGAKNGESVFKVDGRMVDAPVIQQANLILRAVGNAGDV
ncbi:HpcH/HpaI aldolase/citrate lyase family protein [Terasakiella pusilla]|uniref:HpcH/HpaI aldolase/citrate lyase family protein n=1 Tax=Terasakiella pusilla TaxID=64973 RepID=UPI003AA7FF24